MHVRLSKKSAGSVREVIHAVSCLLESHSSSLFRYTLVCVKFILHRKLMVLHVRM